MKGAVKKSTLMTEGNIVKLLITFSLPLLAGNLFQQLYNTVDSYIVGNYVSHEAFAAVGSIGPIINTLVGTFSGLATGAGVVVSQYYGAGDKEKVRATVNTSMIMTAVLSILFTVIGVIFTPYALQLMNTNADTFDLANEYLTIYFAGITGLLFYNMGAGVLRAIGDSRGPFVLLVISAVINTVLDLVFVLVFKMGVAGVAYATIIAQAVSAIVVVVMLLKTKECYGIRIGKNMFDFAVFKSILKVGFPAALQMAVTSFSNIFVQSYINAFDTHVMAGWTAYNKIDMFAMLPMTSISLASTTFVGQNLGAGNIERAKKGTRTALAMAMSLTAACIVPIMLFADPLIMFFDPTPEMLPYGRHILLLLSPFYLLCCFNQIYAGALRGAGDSKAPMFIMLGSFVVFRQIYLYVCSVLTATVPEMTALTATVLSYPAGWLVCSIIMFFYYHNSNWEKKSIVKAKLVSEASQN